MNIIHESAHFSDVNIQNKKNGVIEFISCMQSADTPNRNGRIYPKRVLEKALDSPTIREKLATKTWFGEAGHPLDSSVQRQMSIDMRNIAFIIKEIWWEGNLLKAKCETALTSVGRDMAGLIEQGCKVAFSLRAQGNVHTNPTTGLVEVEEGLQILCYDFVCTPSHAQAFMEKICEDTIVSMYKTTRGRLTSEILCESENLFLNGDMYDPADMEHPEEIDYTKSYTPDFKKPEEMYTPDEGDEVTSMDSDVTTIENTNKNIMKRVLTEDYLVKDIRSRIRNMF